jgi:hypothetical protein
MTTKGTVRTGAASIPTATSAAAKAPATASKLDVSMTTEGPEAKKTLQPPAASNPPHAPAVTIKPPPPKSRPPKGKASVVCGCYGALHKPLTNCLYCGRISCEREGYDFCPFCGVLVEQVIGGEGYVPMTYVCCVLLPCIVVCSTHSFSFISTKAWEHKERLLRFDRDFARRTVVLDDQADFFTSNKSWLTEEERIVAEEKQAEQMEKLRTRAKQTLDIGF